MPFYAARGVGVCLYSALVPTPTPTKDAVSSAISNDDGRFGTISGQGFHRGTRLTETRVAFPSDDQDRALNWLGDAPFWQVEVGGDLIQGRGSYGTRYNNADRSASTRKHPAGTSSDQLNLIQTFLMNVNLSEKSFRSGLALGQGILKLEVFINGQLSQRTILRQSDLIETSGDNRRGQSTADTCISIQGNQVEIVLRPNTTSSDKQQLDLNEMRITKWRETCKNLKNEADIRCEDKASRGQSGQLLKLLGSLQMPFQVFKKKKQANRDLRIVDVVATFGNYDTVSTDIVQTTLRKRVINDDKLLQQSSTGQTRIDKPQLLEPTTSTNLETVSRTTNMPDTAYLDFGLDGTNENIDENELVLKADDRHPVVIDWNVDDRITTATHRPPLAPVYEQGRGYPDIRWIPYNHIRTPLPSTFERPMSTSSISFNPIQFAQSSMQSRLPPTGLYQVTQKPKTKVGARQHISISRLVIRGKDGNIVVDRLWYPPKNVPVKSRTSSDKLQAPGGGTQIPVPKPKPESAPNASMTLETPPFDLLSPTMVRSRSLTQNRPFSSSILGIQGPKANPYVFDDPEEVLRMNKRQRTAARLKEGGATSPLTVSEISTQPSSDVNKELMNAGVFSPLSSLPSTPTFGSMSLPTLPFSPTTKVSNATSAATEASKYGSSIGEGPFDLASPAVAAAMMNTSSDAGHINPPPQGRFLEGIDAAINGMSELYREHSNLLQSTETKLDVQGSMNASLVESHKSTVATQIHVAEDMDHQDEGEDDIERTDVESDDGFQEEYVMCSFRYFIHG